MAGFTVLHDISRELQLQVIATLVTAPDASFDASDSTIVLKPPSDKLGTTVKAVLYLYHIGIDPHLRNQSRPSDKTDPTLFIRPPLPLHLRYLFVPVSDDDVANQLMLGRVLQHFHDEPTFRPTPGSSLATSRGGVPDTIRVRPDLAGFEVLSQLWSALSRPFRLSAGFIVDIAAIESGAAAQITPRVSQTATATAKRRPEVTS